jgi:hypothetical protein
LKNKSNPIVNNKIEYICKSYFNSSNSKNNINLKGKELNQNHIEEKEKITLQNKIKDIDKKYDSILKENKELKQLIHNKTNDFMKLYKDISTFKTELKHIKNKILI